MPAETAKLIVHPPEAVAGAVRYAATLQEADGTSEHLWWRVPEEWSGAVTDWADPWIVGLLFPIMRRDRPVHVLGVASPSLLARLELFMAIWRVWTRGEYRPAAITADEEAEQPPATEPGVTLVGFSGGVDSSFTAYRHAHRLAGRRSVKLAAGVMQHGFDVPLDAYESDALYLRLLRKSEIMLGSLGLRCIPIATNFLKLGPPWKDAWGTQLASGLSLFAKRYDSALVANDLPYAWLGISWPLHPATTHLLSSDRFRLIDDGGEFTRSEKAKTISVWPEAMQNLHVCFGIDIPGSDANCCRCEKCARTILAFRAAQCPRPEAFPKDVDDAFIRSIQWSLSTRTLRWQQITTDAEKAGLGGEAWVKAARHAIRYNEWRVTRSRLQRPFIPIRNRIRRFLRGTTLSRSEIASGAGQPPSSRP